MSQQRGSEPRCKVHAVCMLITLSCYIPLSTLRKTKMIIKGKYPKINCTYCKVSVRDYFFITRSTFLANVHTQYSTIRKYSTYSQFQNGKCEQPLSFTQNARYIFFFSSRWVLHKHMVSFFVLGPSTNSKHFFSGFSDFSANTLWWSRHMIKKWLKKGSQTQILGFPPGLSH